MNVRWIYGFICMNIRWISGLVRESYSSYEDELKPKVGQVFDTLEEDELFHENYAHIVGFSVRSSTLTKDKNGVELWKYFVCLK